MGENGKVSLCEKITNSTLNRVEERSFLKEKLIFHFQDFQREGNPKKIIVSHSNIWKVEIICFKTSHKGRPLNQSKSFDILSEKENPSLKNIMLIFLKNPNLDFEKKNLRRYKT